MPTKFVMIWNKNAGSSARSASLHSVLAGRSDIASFDLEPSLNLDELIVSAEGQGATAIIAAGGDGTVNALASALLRRKSKLCLGIIPFGTGNDFARSLGIPLDPIEAFSLIEHGTSILIDAVQLDAGGKSDFLINVASGGLSTQVSKTNKGLFKKLLGSFSYAMKALATAFGSDRFMLKITLDQTMISLRAANIIAANGRFCGGGAEVAPRASLTDGLLDFFVLKDFSPLDLLRLSTKFAAGDHMEDDKVFFCRAKTITIHSRPSFRLSTDGEVKHRTPITLSIIPSAVKVIGQTSEVSSAD